MQSKALNRPLLSQEASGVGAPVVQLGSGRIDPCAKLEGAGGSCMLSGLGDEEESLEAKEREKARAKLLQAISLSLFFMFVEIAGGLMSNSLAVLTDAAHLLSDIASFAISLFALWMAGWRATPIHSFGYHRMEILGALLSIQLIWMITGILVYEAIMRLMRGTAVVDGRLMFITACFGVCVNLLMSLILTHDHGHPHAHAHALGHTHAHAHDEHSHSHVHTHNHGDRDGHSHSHSNGRSHGVLSALKAALLLSSPEASTTQVTSSPRIPAHVDTHSHSHHDHDNHEHSHSHTLAPEETQTVAIGIEATPLPLYQNINLTGAHLHVLGDLIQSVGVMIAGAIIWWKPEWKVVDLMCTLLFSLLVLWTTLRMVYDIMSVLMESTPRGIEADKVLDEIKELPNVESVHELHIWSITVGKTLLACHVRIPCDADSDEVRCRVAEFCTTKYNIHHVTIQVERVPGVRITDTTRVSNRPVQSQ